MQWTLTPKPSAELCKLLEGLKAQRSHKPLGSMEERAVGLAKRIQRLTRVNEKGCIEWMGTYKGEGYGGTLVGGKSFRVHRLVWMLYRGDIPKGILVCHTCDNRKCVNLDHLWLGTLHDNNKDTASKGRLSASSLKNLEKGRVICHANQEKRRQEKLKA